MNDDQLDVLVKEAMASDPSGDVWPLVREGMQPWWTRIRELAMPVAVGALTLMLLHSVLPSRGFTEQRTPQLAEIFDTMLLPETVAYVPRTSSGG